MHEAGIMKNALSIVARAAAENDVAEVTEIKLVIGAKRVVLPDALLQAFNAFVREDALFRDCRLVVETREIRLRCRGCGHEYDADLSVAPCGQCGSRDTDLLQGDELLIDYFLCGEMDR